MFLCVEGSTRMLNVNTMVCGMVLSLWCTYCCIGFMSYQEHRERVKNVLTIAVNTRPKIHDHHTPLAATTSPRHPPAITEATTTVVTTTIMLLRGPPCPPLPLAPPLTQASDSSIVFNRLGAWGSPAKITSILYSTSGPVALLPRYYFTQRILTYSRVSGCDEVTWVPVCLNVCLSSFSCHRNASLHVKAHSVKLRLHTACPVGFVLSWAWLAGQVRSSRNWKVKQGGTVKCVDSQWPRERTFLKGCHKSI